MTGPLTGPRGVIGLVLACSMLAQAAAADLRPLKRPAPDAVATLTPVQGMRPRGRVAAAGPSAIVVATSNGAVQPAPRLRPAGLASAVAAALPAAPPPQSALAIARSSRPEPRPAITRRAEARADVIPVAAIRTLPGREAIVGRKGSVCGVASIKGQTIAPITSRVRGCGVAEPVRVTSVAGVALSEAATIDCPTARALDAWVYQAVQPRFNRDPVVRLQVAGHYVCRPRNNIAGGKISEHGKGRAIDISGFTLASGQTVTVAQDWRRRGDGAAMKAAYKAACGVFRTTLGPGSDGHHEDHMHFDTSGRKGGAYCH